MATQAPPPPPPGFGAGQGQSGAVPDSLRPCPCASLARTDNTSFLHSWLFAGREGPCCPTGLQPGLWPSWGLQGRPQSLLEVGEGVGEGREDSAVGCAGEGPSWLFPYKARVGVSFRAALTAAPLLAQRWRRGRDTYLSQLCQECSSPGQDPGGAFLGAGDRGAARAEPAALWEKLRTKVGGTLWGRGARDNTQ